MFLKANQIRTQLVLLITGFILVACGGTGTVSTAPPIVTPEVTDVSATLVGSPNLAPIMVAYDDGSLQYWDGTPTLAFPFLPGTSGFDSPVATMTSYDPDSGHHDLVVALANNALLQFDGSVWRTINQRVPITKTVAYKNSIIVGFSTGAVMQFVNGSFWHTLHSEGWTSAVSQMSVDNNNLIVALANGQVFQWDGSDNSGSCDGTANSCGWADLNSPAKNQSISNLIIYGQNAIGQPMLAMDTGNAQLWRYDGNWTLIASAIASQFTQLAAIADPITPGQSDFLVASTFGNVLLSTPKAGYTVVISSDDAADAITQLIVYQGTVIAGHLSGLVIQAKPNQDGSFTQTTIAGDGWNSAVAQFVIDDSNNLLARLADGSIKQWNGSSNSAWTELHDNQWDSAMTQMSIYNGLPTFGFQDGSIRQSNGQTNKFVQSAKFDSNAVNKIVKWGNAGFVVLNNASVYRSSGANLQLVHTPAPILYSDGDLRFPIGYDYANLEILGNGELVECSMVAQLSSFSGNYATGYSGSLIEAVASTDTNASRWNNIASWGAYFQGTNWFPASIIQTAADPDSGNFYAAFGDRSIIMWDGVKGDYTQVLIGTYKLPTEVLMKVYNTKLFVAADDGAIYRIDAQNSWSKVHNSWGTQVTNAVLYNGKLIFGLSTGAIEQCDGNCTVDGKGWSELHDFGWNAPVTQMMLYNDNLIVGLGKYGAVEQWDGYRWTELHGNGWGAAVNRLINNGTLIAGLDDGSIMQWAEGTQWVELNYSPVPHPHSIRLMAAL